jgi:tripartite-type tricarboxylate transporter receptor subunit TctC
MKTPSQSRPYPFFVRWGVACLSLFLTLVTSATLAQEAWPNHPIKLVVPFQAGSSTDVAARVIASRMSNVLNQTLVIENKIGASGFIGAEFVSKANNDGYTILWGTTSTQIIGPIINGSAAYDPIKDFSPIGLIAFSPYILVTSGKSNVKTLKDLMELARSKPKEITYASAGNTSVGNLSAQLLSQTAKVSLSHIPYKSSAQSVTDTMTGIVYMQFSSIAPVLTHLKTGSLKALAITSKQRISIFPDVPTVAESGYPGYEALLWMGLFTPQGVNNSIVEKITQALKVTLNDPEVQKTLQSQGLQPSNVFREELGSFVKSEINKWSQVIKTAGIQAD